MADPTSPQPDARQRTAPPSSRPPPLHPHCRSLLVPGLVQRSQVPASAPVGPVAAPAPSAPVAAPTAAPAPPTAVRWAPAYVEPEVREVGGRPIVGPRPELLSLRIAAQRWRERGIDLPEAVLADVFGEAAPSPASLEAAWSDRSLGAQARILKATPKSKRVHFELVVETLGGVRLSDGVAGRSIQRLGGRLVVKNELLALYDDAPQGLGAAMTRNSLAAYSHMGVDEVQVDALWLGRYAWATFGFQWDAATAARVRVELKDFLVRHGVSTAVAQSRASALSARPWDVGELSLGSPPIVAAYDYEKVTRTGWQKQSSRANLGKAFLLSGPPWSGAIDLSDARSDSWTRAWKRLFLSQ